MQKWQKHEYWRHFERTKMSQERDILSKEEKKMSAYFFDGEIAWIMHF